MEEQKKETDKNKRTILLIAGILSVCFIVYIVYMMTFLNAPRNLSGEPGYISFTKDFHQVMLQRLKAEKIRQWMSTLEEEKFDGKLYHVMLSHSLPIQLPIAIRCLDDELNYVTLYKNEEGNRCINVQWGGPVAHWGVVIGPKEMPIPQTVDVSYDKDGFRNIGEYRLKLEDGAYVWHEIK